MSANSNEKTITFSYNPKGIRIGKTINGVKHDYVLEGTKLIRDAHNGVDYLYDAEDQVCGIVYDGNAYYFYKNLQGDVIAITNASGIEIARYSYDAWGVCTITGLTELGTAVANKNMFRYRSYIYDTDLGLYYLQSRYYDPQTGRFINGDEVAYLGANETSLSYNLFIYCVNDSVNKIDPFGNAALKVGILAMSDSLTRNFEFAVRRHFTEFGGKIAFRKFLAASFPTFLLGWTHMHDVDILFLDFHGDPYHLQNENGGMVLNTQYSNLLCNINAKFVFLNVCNGGHYDHRYTNIAHYLSMKICGSLIASDGTVYSYQSDDTTGERTFQSKGDLYWKEYNHANYPPYRMRLTNYGWMLYQHGKQPRCISYRKAATFDQMMNFLKQNRLF